MKGYTYVEVRQGTYVKKICDYNPETDMEEVFEIRYVHTVTLKCRVYDDITMGRAKRIARNSSFNWKPWVCGMNGRKLKDKKYMSGGCNFLYNSKTRRLTTRIPHCNIRILSKTLWVKER